MDRERVKNLLDNERARQDAKWGADRKQSHHIWLIILTEEVGEAAKGILEIANDPGDIELRNEVVQCMAVCAAWLEANWKA